MGYKSQAFSVLGATIVRCSTASSGSYAQAPNGVIFQSALGLRKPFTDASGNGVTTALSSRLCAIYPFACVKTALSTWIPR